MSITYLTLVLLVKKANGGHAVPIFCLPACTGKPQSAQMVPPAKNQFPGRKLSCFRLVFRRMDCWGVLGWILAKKYRFGGAFWGAFWGFYFYFFPTFLHSKGLSIELLFIYVYTNLIYVEWRPQCRGALFELRLYEM